MKTLKTITFSLFALAFVTTSTYAIGTLTPSGTPGENTQVSLTDIYNKILNINATPEAKSAPDFDNPLASFRTLSEIYALLETNQPVVVPENIREGVEIFGVEGDMIIEGIIFATQWSNGQLDQSWVSWQTAYNFCHDLTEGGHEDWRLPTSKELINAYLTGVGGFNTDDFEGYWSSTPIPSHPNYIYFVYMDYGNMENELITNATLFARCVREFTDEDLGPIW